MYTNVQFDYGGGYSEDHEWISRNSLYAILFRTSSLEEITYAVLVDKICRKIGVDETAGKVKLSYSLCKDRRETYILDDEEVLIYLMSLDKDGLKPVLKVELLNGVENNDRLDQVSRAERISSFGVNYVDPVLNGRANEMENVGIVAIEEQRNEVNNDEAMEIAVHESVGIDCFGEFASVDSPMNNELVGSVHDLVDLAVGEVAVVDEWEDGTGLELKQEFSSRQAVQDLVSKAANKNCFGYVTVKSDKQRLMLRCRQASNGCKWYVRAARDKNSIFWSIRKHVKMHSCSRAVESTSSSRSRGSQRLVANLLHEDYPGQMDTPAPKSIVNLVQNRLSLECSYSTALRGKRRHVCEIRGSPETSYTLLFSYLHELRKANPETVTSVELDAEKRFKYLFIALGVSIEGFRSMRKVIVVDATFLKTKYKGMLVFATAQDPNHHHYPIAFGVIDGEKDVSWNCFFTKLKTIIPDNPELVFISDRHQSIINAVDTVYPSSKHGHCIWHLSQNVRGKVLNDKDGAAEKFRACAHAYTETGFRREYADFAARWPAAAKYLNDGIALERWTRCYFQGDKYNIDTSNSAESMNSVFRKARAYPLLPMIDAIVEKMSEWFNKHRNTSVGAPNFKKVVPYVENILHQRCETAKRLSVRELNGYRLEYAVTGVNGKTYLVNLRMRRCSCRCFDIDKYPCVHAIAACSHLMRKEGREESIQLYDLCSNYYLTQTWALAYEKMIYCVPHESEWSIPAEIKALYALPPKVEPRKGRLVETRFPSGGEARRKAKYKYKRGINLERWLQPENA